MAASARITSAIVRARAAAVGSALAARGVVGRVAASSVATAPHFKSPPPSLPGTVTKNTEEDYMLSHAVYTAAEVNSVTVTHVEPELTRDKLALLAITGVRKGFDLVTGYRADSPMTARQYLLRIIFLETIAGVPGMVAAMARHLRSLRTMRRDFGWIHSLLEEAENERMHLLTFAEVYKAGPFMRAMVLLGQGVAWNLYFPVYLLAPRACHRFVGYLEEEAVRTYTHILHDIDSGHLAEWKTAPAPDIAKRYWRLGPNATMRDLVLAVRADESIHRDVNHTLTTLPEGVKNPFA